MENAFNLVSSDLKRLKKDKSFYVIMIIMMAIVLFVAIVFKIIFNIMSVEDMQDMLNSSGVGLNLKGAANSIAFVYTFLLMFGVGNLGIFIAAACSAFTGRDFSYNTIRNKIISGSSRTKIYMSSLCSNLILALVYYVVYTIFSLIICLIFFGTNDYIGNLLVMALSNIIPYIALVSIVTFISMTAKSNALGTTINILVLIFVPVIFSALTSFNSNEGIENFLKVMLFPVIGEIASLNIVPSDNISDLVSFTFFSGGMNYLRMILVSIIHFIIFTAGGLFLFNRADIK